jgi:transcription elongation factor Elf1
MIRVLYGVKKDEFIDECDECNAYVAYSLKDIKKSFNVYYVICPECGNKIEVVKEVNKTYV